MIRIFVIFMTLGSLAFAEVDISGHVDFNTQVYLIKPDSKHKNNFTAEQTLELKYEKDSLSAFAKLYAHEDYYDIKEDSQRNKRTIARVDEAYLKYDFEEDTIEIGKSIKFWGALELNNIVDGFNPNDFRSDMFSSDKLGVWNASYSHYTESGEFSLIVKFYEQDQEMPAFPYVYYFLPQSVSYNKNLNSSHSNKRASIYLTYSGSTDSDYPIDYAFIYENGYDSQRYFTTNATELSAPTKFEQNVYLVNKFMTYNTMVVDSTLIKLEALYAKVEENKEIGDYAHIAFGVEHTLENFDNGSALGLISEYYNYITFDSDKYDDLKLFETMQNDLFLGARYTFNNEDDSSIVGGLITDLEYHEQVYYAQFESRLLENYKITFDYYYIEPSKNSLTSYALLGRHQRIAMNLAWYF